MSFFNFLNDTMVNVANVIPYPTTTRTMEVHYMWSRHCISRNNCHISQFFALCPCAKSPNWSDDFLSMIFGILGEIGIEIVEYIFYIKIFFDRKHFDRKTNTIFRNIFRKKIEISKKEIFRRFFRKILISKNILNIFRKKSSKNQF